MFRMFLFFVIVGLLAAGLAWMADRPGNMLIEWQGYQVQFSVFIAMIALTAFLGVTIFLWSLLRSILSSPSAIGRHYKRKRQKKGLDSLSSGLIAIGSGDRDQALKYAGQARRTLPNDPITQILRAQAAQLAGDDETARRIYESMLAAKETQQMGLRGLFLAALEQKELEAAKQYAARAVDLNPELGWAIKGLLDLNCRSAHWEDALTSLDLAIRHQHIDNKLAKRQRAVLLTAIADDLEESDRDKALESALDAHYLAPNLVPAAVIAGRIMAGQGQMAKANKIIRKTWKIAPHPELAVVSAYARPGDSPKDRLARVAGLAKLIPGNREGYIAHAVAAIEAREWAVAREALSSLSRNNPTQRVCTLMARIEGSERGDAGRVREWLARAVHAGKDPAWIADGIVSDQWAPISPVSGKLDAFEWRVPVEDLITSSQQTQLEQLLASTALVSGPTSSSTAIGTGPLEAEEVVPGDVIEAGSEPESQPPAQDTGVVAQIDTPEVEPSKDQQLESSPPQSPPQKLAIFEDTTQVGSQHTKEEVLEQHSQVETKREPEAFIETPAGNDQLPAPASAIEISDAELIEAEDQVSEAISNVPSQQDTSLPEPGPAIVETTEPQVRIDVETEAKTPKETLQPKKKITEKPKIFIPPRAPDDPGTDPVDMDDVKNTLQRYRNRQP